MKIHMNGIYIQCARVNKNQYKVEIHTSQKVNKQTDKLTINYHILSNNSLDKNVQKCKCIFR